MQAGSSKASRNFYPRPPRGGRPCGADPNSYVFEISIHALREEGDIIVAVPQLSQPDFYPRPPRGGRLVRFNKRLRKKQISIHALREEGDAAGDGTDRRMGDFYPRPPRGGRRCTKGTKGRKPKFLSTPSARRATTTMWKNTSWPMISIHALREEGDRTSLLRRTRGHPISIHALREEGDEATQRSGLKGLLFLSTPSARRATAWFAGVVVRRRNFYPRPPRGGRP